MIKTARDNVCDSVVFIEEFNTRTRKSKNGSSTFFCEACGDELIPNLGKIKAKHFSHKRREETAHCRMTSLHIAGQEIIKELGEIEFPDTLVEATAPPCTKKYPITLVSRPLELRDIKLEKSVQTELGNIVGDVVGDHPFDNVTHRINIEVFVTNPISERKEQKIKSVDLTTFEVDLSDLLKTDWDKKTLTAHIKDPKYTTLSHLSTLLANQIAAPSIRRIKESEKREERAKREDAVKAKKALSEKLAQKFENHLNTITGTLLASPTFKKEESEEPLLLRIEKWEMEGDVYVIHTDVNGEFTVTLGQSIKNAYAEYEKFGPDIFSDSANEQPKTLFNQHIDQALEDSEEQKAIEFLKNNLPI